MLQVGALHGLFQLGCFWCTHPVRVAKRRWIGGPCAKWRLFGDSYRPGAGANLNIRSSVPPLVTYHKPLIQTIYHLTIFQGTIGCTPNSVPMVFIGISHKGTLVGVHPTIPWILKLQMVLSFGLESNKPNLRSHEHLISLYHHCRRVSERHIYICLYYIYIMIYIYISM